MEASDYGLQDLDNLIKSLEALITDVEEAPFEINIGDSSKKITYIILDTNSKSSLYRNQYTANATFLKSDKLIFQCLKTDAVRQSPIDATIEIAKTGHGEDNCNIRGITQSIKRIRGGYEVEIKITENKRTKKTARQKLQECVEKNDPITWNRWCSDIKDHLDLANSRLINSNLKNYDFCCANFDNSDLSGSDLSDAILAGSDLSNTNLDNIKILGADLFRAKIPRRYANLINLSGMLETESIILSNDQEIAS